MTLAILIILVVIVLGGILIHIQQVNELSEKLRGMEGSLKNTELHVKSVDNNLGVLKEDLIHNVGKLSSQIGAVEALSDLIRNKNEAIIESLSGVSYAITTHMQVIQSRLDKTIQLSRQSEQSASEYRASMDLHLKRLAENVLETKRALTLLESQEQEHFQILLREDKLTRGAINATAGNANEMQRQAVERLVANFSSTNTLIEKQEEHVRSAVNTLNASVNTHFNRFNTRLDETMRVISDLKNDQAEKLKEVLREEADVKIAVSAAAASAVVSFGKSAQAITDQADKIFAVVDHLEQEVKVEHELLRTSMVKADNVTTLLFNSVQSIKQVHQLHTDLAEKFERISGQQDEKNSRLQELLSEKATNMEQHIAAVYQDFNLMLELLKAGLMNDLVKELNQKLAN